MEPTSLNCKKLPQHEIIQGHTNRPRNGEYKYNNNAKQGSTRYALVRHKSRVPAVHMPRDCVKKITDFGTTQIKREHTQQTLKRCSRKWVTFATRLTREAKTKNTSPAPQPTATRLHVKENIEVGWCWQMFVKFSFPGVSRQSQR